MCICATFLTSNCLLLTDSKEISNNSIQISHRPRNWLVSIQRIAWRNPETKTSSCCDNCNVHGCFLTSKGWVVIKPGLFENDSKQYNTSYVIDWFWIFLWFWFYAADVKSVNQGSVRYKIVIVLYILPRHFKTTITFQHIFDIIDFQLESMCLIRWTAWSTLTLSTWRILRLPGTSIDIVTRTHPYERASTARDKLSTKHMLDMSLNTVCYNKSRTR